MPISEKMLKIVEGAFLMFSVAEDKKAEEILSDQN